MISLETLSASYKSHRKDLPDDLAIRLHRAQSWLRAAERYKDDPDICFLTLWVGFCACFSASENVHTKLGERASFAQYVERLAYYDSEGLLSQVLWETYPNAVRSLLANKYIFSGFWLAQETDGNWEDEFNRQSKRASRYFKEHNSAKILMLTLDRLSVLRNQIFYGGATYQSKVNRSQINDGIELLSLLVPTIVHVMLSSPSADWGQIYYPVVNTVAPVTTE